ncbi:DUF58 domain-containing protein [Palaeococcus sp. (in: euryarchaeotes)]
MRREDFLFTLAFLLMLEGYLGENITPALLGIFLLIYIYGVRSRVSFAVSGERILEEKRLEEGKWSEVILRIRNDGEAVFVTPFDLNEDFEVSKLEGFSLKKGEVREVKYIIKPKRKGRFKLKPLHVMVEDKRGLYFDEVIIGEEVDVSVYPSVESMKEAARAEYNLRLAEMYKKSKFLGTEGLDIKDLREYHHGDDFKRIDWKATARLGEMIVRDFIKESNADVYIFLDNTKEMRKGIKKAKIDYASVLALQLAANLVRNFRVGMVIYDDLRAGIVKAGKGSTQLEIMRRKLDLRGEKGVMSLKFEVEVRLSEKARGFLSKVMPLKKGRRGSKGVFEGLSLIKQPSFLIFITDLSNPSELYKAVAQARGNHRILILSPNPILFYGGELDGETLKRLYKAYVEREKLLRKFSALVPTIDLGPSDYIRELAKVV